MQGEPESPGQVGRWSRGGRGHAPWLCRALYASATTRVGVNQCICSASPQVLHAPKCQEGSPDCSNALAASRTRRDPRLTHEKAWHGDRQRSCNMLQSRGLQTSWALGAWSHDHQRRDGHE